MLMLMIVEIPLSESSTVVEMEAINRDCQDDKADDNYGGEWSDGRVFQGLEFPMMIVIILREIGILRAVDSTEADILFRAERLLQRLGTLHRTPLTA